MQLLILLAVIAAAFYVLKTREQGKRIALLGSHLGQYQVEKLMESLTQGYLRALGEKDPERQAQIWNLMSTSEGELSDQFKRFAEEFSRIDGQHASVSTLPVFIPYADRWLPGKTFDVRQALALHAEGIQRAAENSIDRTPKAKAFALSAELFLMQHTCHWFCRSRTVASARLMARHQTSYEQVLASVDPQTREAYRTLTGL